MERFLPFSLPLLLALITLYSCKRDIPEEVFQPGNGPYLKEVAENLYFVEDFNNGGNVCFLVARKEVLMVDAGNYPGPVKKVAGLISKVTDNPITKLVLTHSHGDHVGGLAGLPDDVEIIAHENLPGNIEKFFLPRIEAFQKELDELGEDSLKIKYGDRYDDLAAMKFRMPDVMFQETSIIDLGNYTVELTYPGSCHTSDNILVFFKEQKVLHTGDIVFNERHPYVMEAYGANPQTWGEVAAEWSEKDIELVIPGHGPLGGTEILKAQADYFNTLMKAVEECVDSDTEFYQMASDIHAKYFGHMTYARYFDMAVEAAYNLLTE